MGGELNTEYATYDDGKQISVTPLNTPLYELSFWGVNTNKNGISKPVISLNVDNGYYPYGLETTLNQNNIDRASQQRQQELNILKNASDHSMNMDIAGATLGGITGLTNLGLGIWGAIESNKNLKKQREVANKQIALAEEQIQASKQYRDERAKEIARLNRVRSNTTKAFNTGSVITRSY